MGTQAGLKQNPDIISHVHLFLDPRPCLFYLLGWFPARGHAYNSLFSSRILRRQSENTLAISLWSLDEDGASIEGLELISDGTFRSSMEFEDYIDAPDYSAQKNLRPDAVYYSPLSDDE